MIIKYKVYIKKDNKMYNVIALYTPFKNELYNRIFIDKEKHLIEPNNYRVDNKEVVLLEITDRLDYSNKEITDGDIILHADHKKYVIKKFKYSFYALDIENNSRIITDSFFINDLHKNCKVIGNIYQNEELIND